MAVSIILFGQLAEITGAGRVQINDVQDTDQLVAELTERYPALASVSYRIAVQRDIITDNTCLKENDTVALLPPFAGG